MKLWAALVAVGFILGCRTTGTDLTLLQKADGVYLYHHARYECACRQVPEAGLDCAGAVPVFDCGKLHTANSSLLAAISTAEYVRKGTLGPKFDGIVALPKEQRAHIADLMDACKVAK